MSLLWCSRPPLEIGNAHSCPLGFADYNGVMKLAQSMVSAYGLHDAVMGPEAWCPIDYWKQLGAFDLGCHSYCWLFGSMIVRVYG